MIKPKTKGFIYKPNLLWDFSSKSMWNFGLNPNKSSLKLNFCQKLTITTFFTSILLVYPCILWAFNGVNKSHTYFVHLYRRCSWDMPLSLNIDKKTFCISFLQLYHCCSWNTLLDLYIARKTFNTRDPTHDSTNSIYIFTSLSYDNFIGQSC